MCEGEGCKPTPETVVPVSFPGSLLPRSPFPCSSSLLFLSSSLTAFVHLFVCLLCPCNRSSNLMFLSPLPPPRRSCSQGIASEGKRGGEGRVHRRFPPLLLCYTRLLFFFIRVRRTMNRRMESTGRLIRQISSSRTSSCLPLPP